jgi:hypothetical protein
LSPYVHLDRTKIRKIHPRTQNTKKIISAISGLVVRFELSARSEIDVKSGRTRKSGDIHQEFVRIVPRRKSPRNSQLCVLCACPSGRRASAVSPVRQAPKEWQIPPLCSLCLCGESGSALSQNLWFPN